jgi:hypothetical protein
MKYPTRSVSPRPTFAALLAAVLAARGGAPAAEPPAPELRNGGFEEVGRARDAARSEPAWWVLDGDAVAIGAIDRDAFPLYAMEGRHSLFVGVDFVGGASTSGRAWQDVGRTVPGRHYVAFARVKWTETFPPGYRLALSDAETGEVLASVTDRVRRPGRQGETIEIRFGYRETAARSLRLEIGTRGGVGPGEAFRAGIDAVSVISAETPPPGTVILEAPKPRAPAVPAGEPLEIENGRVRVRLSPMSDGIHQEFLARRGAEWVPVARALRPQRPFPEDGVALYDSAIDREHRLIATELLEKASGPFLEGDRRVLKLAGDSEGVHVEETISLGPSEPFAHIEIAATLPGKPPRLEYLLLPLEVLVDRPDFTHLPTLKRGPDALAGDRVFCAPAAMVQRDRVFAAIVPDLDLIEGEIVYARGARPQTHPRVFAVPVDPGRISFPVALDLELRSGLTPRPLLAYGAIDVIANQHVWWRHDNAPGAMVRELSRDRIHLGLDLFVSADAAPGREYQAVSRHHWRRYGSKAYRRPRPQAMPYAEYARICYPATFAYQGYEVAPGSRGLIHRSQPGRREMDLWQEWEVGGRRAGALRLTAPQWFHLAYDTVWWNNAGDAEGMLFWGGRLGEPDLIERAKRIVEFVLSAPQREGLFPSLYDLSAKRWLGSLWRPPAEGYDPGAASAYWAPGCRGVYQTASASVTAGFLLRLDRTGAADPRILPYVRRLGDFLLDRMGTDGCVPAWFGDDLRPLPSLRWNAEGGAHIEVLARLGALLGEPRYIEGAERMARFLIDEVLPGQRWSDFECFYSCAVKPETYRDPRTGQPARDTMAMLWALQGLLALDEATGKAAYRDAAEAVADYASFWQAVWAPHFIITAYPFGGWTSQLGDAEWLDQRAHRFAGPFVELGLRTGRQDLIERGVAAARSGLTLASHPLHAANGIYGHGDFPAGLGPENIDHEGFPQNPLSSGPSWSTVGGLAGIARVLGLLGSAHVDFERNLAVGVDGVRVRRYERRGSRVIVDLDGPLAELPRPWRDPFEIELRLVGLPAGTYELVLDGRSRPGLSDRDLARYRTTWSPAER